MNRNDENLAHNEYESLIVKIVSQQLNPFDVYIGHKIKERRKELKLSQQQVAYILGITFQQLQKYEKGLNRISAERLWDISYLLQIPFDAFFKELSVFFEKVKTLAPSTINTLRFQDSNSETIQTKEEVVKSDFQQPDEPNKLETLFSLLDEKEVSKFYEKFVNELKEKENQNKANPYPTVDEQHIEEIKNLYKRLS